MREFWKVVEMVLHQYCKQAYEQTLYTRRPLKTGVSPRKQALCPINLKHTMTSSFGLTLSCHQSWIHSLFMVM